MWGAPRRDVASLALEAVPADAGPRVAGENGAAVHVASERGALDFVSRGVFAKVFVAPVSGIRVTYGDMAEAALDVPAGGMILYPAHSLIRATWISPLESVSIGFVPGYLEDLARTELGVEAIEMVPPRPAHVDERALGFAELFKAEIHTGGSGSDLYFDSLLTAFAVYLLRAHSNVSKLLSVPRTVATLPAAAAREVEEYLRAHLARKISVAELADLAGLSRSRFVPAFRATFGLPPHQFLLSLRVAHAERLLSETDLPLAQVSAASGFSSQSHLTNAMTRRRQITPGDLRKPAKQRRS